MSGDHDRGLSYFDHIRLILFIILVAYLGIILPVKANILSSVNYA